MHSKYKSVYDSASRGSVTLAELLAALVVSALTMAAIYQISLLQNDTYRVQNQLAEMEQMAETAKAMIVRELEMAGYRPVSTATFPGVEYDPAQLRIRADLNGNGTTNEAREDILYRYDATTARVVRSTGGAQIVFPNVQAFTISYLKADGTPVTAKADEGLIRQVTVSITFRTPLPDRQYPSNNGYRTLRLDLSVTPRNLGL